MLYEYVTWWQLLALFYALILSALAGYYWNEIKRRLRRFFRRKEVE